MQSTLFAPELSATCNTVSALIIALLHLRVSKVQRPILFGLCNDLDQSPTLHLAERARRGDPDLVADTTHVFRIVGMELRCSLDVLAVDLVLDQPETTLV